MDQVDKLIVEVQGQEKVRELNTTLEGEERLLRALAWALRDGTITQAQFTTESRKAAQSILNLQDEIKKLTGRTGLSGSGILQASYAVQDFTSVLSGGQGLGRALNSIQNNIPGLLMALGASGGLAGIVSLVAVGIGSLIPVVEKLWASFTSDAPEQAKKKLEELKRTAEETHKAFVKLTETPTDIEETSAQAIHGFLATRPNAEMAQEAIVKGMGGKSTQAALTAAGTRDEWGKLGPAAEMSDAEIERQAKAAETSVIMNAPGVPNAGAGVADRTRARLQQERETAQQKRFDLERKAKGAFAESIVVGAQVAGPAGADMRRQLLERTKGAQGLEILQEMSPAAIADQEKAFEEDLEAAEGLIDRARTARQKRNKDDRLAKQLNEQGQQNQEAWQHDRDEAKKHRQQAAIRQKQEEDREGLREMEAAPHNQAVDAVTALSERIGRESGGQLGGTPTAQQADQMADEALRLMQNGLSGQQAVFQSVMHRLRVIIQTQQQANAQMQQQMQMMGGGGPDMGQFSFLPPVW